MSRLARYVNAQPRLIAVVGEFHKELMEEMVSSARARAEERDATLLDVVWVPGSFEAPLALHRVLGLDFVDAAVVLGYIERGETAHGEVMGHAVSRAIVELEIRHDKPVGLGIIGPGATLEQARARASGYASRAVDAALSFFTRG